MKIKLPKQWLHWCKCLRIKPNAFDNRTRWGRYYLVGHDRYWRVTCNGELDVSETFETFDRWANSTEYTWPMPLTFKQFQSYVNQLTQPTIRINDTLN